MLGDLFPAPSSTGGRFGMLRDRFARLTLEIDVSSSGLLEIRLGMLGDLLVRPPRALEASS